MRKVTRSRRSFISLAGGATSATLFVGQRQSAQSNRSRPVSRTEVDLQKQIVEAIKGYGVFDAHEHLLRKKTTSPAQSRFV
jgi:hypothetical protein